MFALSTISIWKTSCSYSALPILAFILLQSVLFYHPSLLFFRHTSSLIFIHCTTALWILSGPLPFSSISSLAQAISFRKNTELKGGNLTLMEKAAPSHRWPCQLWPLGDPLAQLKRPIRSHLDCCRHSFVHVHWEENRLLSSTLHQSEHIFSFLFLIKLLRPWKKRIAEVFFSLSFPKAQTIALKLPEGIENPGV